MVFDPTNKALMIEMKSLSLTEEAFFYFKIIG